MTQTFIHERFGPLLVLPRLGCCFPLTLITGYGNSKIPLKVSCPYTGRLFDRLWVSTSFPGTVLSTGIVVNERQNLCLKGAYWAYLKGNNLRLFKWKSKMTKVMCIISWQMRDAASKSDLFQRRGKSKVQTYAESLKMGEKRRKSQVSAIH